MIRLHTGGHVIFDLPRRFEEGVSIDGGLGRPCLTHFEVGHMIDGSTNVQSR